MRLVKLQELDDLVNSQKYFFGRIFKDDISILDVNYEVLLHNKVIKYYSKKINYNFTEYDIFGDNIIHTDDKYDIVYSFEFCHYKDWEKYLNQATKIAKKYVLVEVAITKNHKTIDDINVCYYHNPFKKININHDKLPFIIQNLDDMLNFCEKELPIKAISFYLYHLSNKSTSTYPIPEKDLLKGGMLLEIGKNKKIKREIIIK